MPLAVACLAATWLAVFLRWTQGTASRPLRIASIQSKDAEVMAYVFTYVFPFLGVDLEKPEDAVSLAVFFGVLLVLQVSANLIHINPILSLIGYHLYEVRDETGEDRTLVTRRARVMRGSSINVVMIADDVLMEPK
jgi:hypothetical protein